MNLHTLKGNPAARSPRKRVGRGPGSGTGKTSGRGHKGQMARKGASHRRGFEGGQIPLIRRLPKRGFNNFNRREYAPVNVGALARFADGAEVTAELMRRAGLVNGRFDGIKILGQGELSARLIVKADAFSSSARTKIEAAGGACEVVRN